MAGDDPLADEVHKRTQAWLTGHEAGLYVSRVAYPLPYHVMRVASFDLSYNFWVCMFPNCGVRTKARCEDASALWS